SMVVAPSSKLRVSSYHIDQVGLVGGRTKSCFFETDSWFRVPRDGNSRGCLGAALLESGSRSLAIFAAIRPCLVAWPLILPSCRARFCYYRRKRRPTD